MSNKNTNNRVSYGQYKAADIGMFLIIMCLCETINVLALGQWFSSQMFSVTVMLLVSLVVIIRWGWIGVIFPVVDGVLYCWLEGATGTQFAVYIIGNAFVALVWIFLKVIGKERVVSSWLLTLVYAALGYVFLVFGRSIIGLFFGESFVSTLLNMLSSELINFLFAAAGLLILRKIDTMLVDQKQYLLKVTKERDEVKPPDEYHWDGYTELEAEDLEKLKAMDEYDRKVTFNRTSLKRLKEDSGEDELLSGGFPEEPAADSPDEDDLSRLDGV